MGSINLVLYQPEIPQNTGNILRTAVATDITVHLIEPLGFRLDEKEIKRSGANYILDAKYILYKDWEEFTSKNPGEYYFLTRYGQKSVHHLDVSNDLLHYYFVLGKESTGIPKELLKENLERCIRLPMTDKVRALNVSNVAAVIVYEALRQQGFKGLSEYEPEMYKGKEYLLK